MTLKIINVQMYYLFLVNFVQIKKAGTPRNIGVPAHKWLYWLLPELVKAV